MLTGRLRSRSVLTPPRTGKATQGNRSTAEPTTRMRRHWICIFFFLHLFSPPRFTACLPSDGPVCVLQISKLSRGVLSFSSCKCGMASLPLSCVNRTPPHRPPTPRFPFPNARLTEVHPLTCRVRVVVCGMDSKCGFFIIFSSKYPFPRQKSPGRQQPITCRSFAGCHWGGSPRVARPGPGS